MTVAAFMGNLIKNASRYKAKPQRQANGVIPIFCQFIDNRGQPYKQAKAYKGSHCNPEHLQNIPLKGCYV